MRFTSKFLDSYSRWVKTLDFLELPVGILWLLNFLWPHYVVQTSIIFGLYNVIFFLSWLVETIWRHHQKKNGRLKR
ncbi:hypothetical protein [Levilactobacillus yonginensis]|uniref:hypothetical protein n=1 Tax=Levilactobacillus yonginensis TaxID=1054041 RepID=UPI00345D4D26